jgi:hypothetical protein
VCGGFGRDGAVTKNYQRSGIAGFSNFRVRMGGVASGRCVLGAALGQSSFYTGSVWPTDPREDLGNFLNLHTHFRTCCLV